MDGTRDRVRPLTDIPAVARPVDLHVHSTASDGVLPPAEVVARAAAAGLGAIALTDHDTLDGLPAAIAAGERLGVRVVPGCEFSVAAPWGEMHLLGYFLPLGWAPLDTLIARSRQDRERRGRGMVEKLRSFGLAISEDDVLAEADGGAIGRPHVARALYRLGLVTSVQDAFDRYIGWGRQAFVEKRLPTLEEVAGVVHAAGGIVSAAHLKERGTRGALAALKAQGLDAVETRHPTHSHDLRSRLTDHTLALGLGRTGGSDWHGDEPDLLPGARLGGQEIPAAWLEALEAARPAGGVPAASGQN